MKSKVLLFVLVLTASMGMSQSVLRYEFLNNLGEKNGLVPTLAVLATEGQFVTDTLNEISGSTKTVYRFEQNCGFQFDNAAAGNFIGNTYSIELYFVFDNLTSWKRVVDWKNRKSDYGAYVYYGELNFYPYVYSGSAPVAPDEYTYYVITRDGTTGRVIIYTDAEEEIDFIDNNNDAIVDADNVVNFFFDDLAVPNEASSGAVALLNMYNYVLDSNTVVSNFGNLGGQVFAVNENTGQGSQVSIYPNPATDRLIISLKDGFGKNDIELRVVNSCGQLVYQETINADVKAQVEIDTREYADGIYFLQITSADSQFTGKFIVKR